jgi:GPH family glycoside/pentoside/hexuronide:cation symporter
MKYNVGSPSALTIALTLSTATAAVAVFPWMLVTKRTSKRFVWLCGAGLAATNAFVFYLTAPGLGPLLWAVIVAGGIATSASYLTFWSTIPDTVEFGEWKTGVRAEGALYGLVVLTQKVALGVGVGVLGILLDAIGYRANQTQMPETLEGIHALLTLPPLFAGLGVFALVSAYPLDRRLHSRLSAAVAWRRSRV